MKRSQIVEKIILGKVVAVIRLNDQDDAIPIVDAILRGGITSVEITMTTPNALKIIETLSTLFREKILVGVGSVLDKEVAEASIRAGAKFVVSPIFNPEVIETAHKNDLPAMPGCFTPTEIYNAHTCGADIIKVFPADVMGQSFFKSLLAPMPFLRLMPTGGVSLCNAGQWLQAGACAVGVGSALTDKQAIVEKNFEKIKANAEQFINSIGRVLVKK